MSSLRTLFPLALVLCFSDLPGQDTARIWNIKALMPNGTTLDLKAFGSDGKPNDVKALQRGDAHLLDIAALVSGAELPVKVIASDEAFLPVKAIATDGKSLDVKAIAPDGSKLDVKGIARSGHVIHIKAIGPDRVLYAVKAISPDGRIHDVKGVRMTDGPVEGQVHGVPVTAHIKAMPRAVATDEEFIWNVKAIGIDGHFLAVKAIDKNGGVHDVKTFMENGDRWIMDVKALINGKKVPVKMLVSDDAVFPVKAIGNEGTIYDIKAMSKDGRKLDVKGTGQEGNILHLKAIDGEKELGVKAISPSGAQYDVKGIKLSPDQGEGNVFGVPVRAHVKAVPPMD